MDNEYGEKWKPTYLDNTDIDLTALFININNNITYQKTISTEAELVNYIYDNTMKKIIIPSSINNLLAPSTTLSNDDVLAPYVKCNNNVKSLIIRENMNNLDTQELNYCRKLKNIIV